MAVHELAQNLPVSRPAVSQHLRVLKDAGLVTDSKAGTRRMYQLDPKGVARLRAHFDLVWERALSAFQEAAESPTGSTAVAGNRAEKGAGKKSEKRRGRHDKDSRGSGRSQKHPGSRAH
jgi:predicted ArsR family transcriptional regulator